LSNFPFYLPLPLRTGLPEGKRIRIPALRSNLVFEVVEIGEVITPNEQFYRQHAPLPWTDSPLHLVLSLVEELLLEERPFWSYPLENPGFFFLFFVAVVFLFPPPCHLPYVFLDSENQASPRRAKSKAFSIAFRPVYVTSPTLPPL